MSSNTRFLGQTFFKDYHDDTTLVLIDAVMGMRIVISLFRLFFLAAGMELNLDKLAILPLWRIDLEMARDFICGSLPQLARDVVVLNAKLLGTYIGVMILRVRGLPLVRKCCSAST